MTDFSVIKPTDQPMGVRRLLNEIRLCLSDSEFTVFAFCVAFAKVGPLQKLAFEIEQWSSRGGRIIGIFGIDQRGTSQQALLYALENFNRSYITNYPNSTFHPKVYLFYGKKKAIVFIGSNNLTVGGLETNFESCIRIDFNLPCDINDFKNVAQLFTVLLPHKCPATYRLTKEILEAHIVDELLMDESKPQDFRPRIKDKISSSLITAPRYFYRLGLKRKPPSPIPNRVMVVHKKQLQEEIKPLITTALSLITSGLAIQIKPHHNGEIFLSKLAVNQNPIFFGWPFTGLTTSKNPNNPTYPQRQPDPIVNIVVVGDSGKILMQLEQYSLNTVYYAKKSEIRITASPLVGLVPDYSIMIMEKVDELGIDYNIIIHKPDSPEYSQWLEVCNQSMPSGGKAPRRFGWF